MASNDTDRRRFLKGASIVAGAAPIALAQEALQVRVAQNRAPAAPAEGGKAARVEVLTN